MTTATPSEPAPVANLPAQPARPKAARAGALRRVGEALLLALPLLGIGELVAHLYFAHRTPMEAAWTDVRAPVLALRAPGDLIVVAPSWAEPHARRALGDDAMPIRDIGRPDVTRYATALEVSILGQRAPELAGWREIAREERGKFLLRRLANPAPERVVFDFVDHIDPSFVDVRGTDPPVNCPWNPKAVIAAGGMGGHPTFPPQRFECPAGVFFNIGVTVIADQDFKARRCIWSHPLQRGEIVTRFRGVPLGRSIRGHGGMYWLVERDLAGTPITLTVRVDGDVIGTYKHADGDGWSLFEMPLGAHAGAPSADVEFAVSSSNYLHRHFCFEADTR